MVEPEHQEGTNIINIRVNSENSRESARVANAFAQSYREYNIQEKYEKTKVNIAEAESQLRTIHGNKLSSSGDLKESFFLPLRIRLCLG